MLHAPARARRLDEMAGREGRKMMSSTPDAKFFMESRNARPTARLAAPSRAMNAVCRCPVGWRGDDDEEESVQAGMLVAKRMMVRPARACAGSAPVHAIQLTTMRPTKKMTRAETDAQPPRDQEIEQRAAGVEALYHHGDVLLWCQWLWLSVRCRQQPEPMSAGGAEGAQPMPASHRCLAAPSLHSATMVFAFHLPGGSERPPAERPRAACVTDRSALRPFYQ